MTSNPYVSPFIGYVGTTVNALCLIHAARQGVISRITQQLNESERRTMIKSGGVFVFCVQESHIKIWTDGLLWFPSRIVGDFLVYRENNERTSSRGHDKAYPHDDPTNACRYSLAYYSLMSACSVCQGDRSLIWSVDKANLTAFRCPIPPSIRLSDYAYLDGETGDIFNVTLVESADGSQSTAAIGGVVLLAILAGLTFALILCHCKHFMPYPAPYNSKSVVSPGIATSDVKLDAPENFYNVIGSEEELVQPVRSNPKAKRNTSKSPKRRPMALEDSNDEETKDESTKSIPRQNPCCPICGHPFSLPMGPYGFTSPHGSASNSHPAPTGTAKTHFVSHHNSYLGCPSYGHPFSFPLRPYGYGVGGPVTVVNFGVGNIANTTISSTGDNNLVKNAYRAHSRSHSH